MPITAYSQWALHGSLAKLLRVPVEHFHLHPTRASLSSRWMQEHPTSWKSLVVSIAPALGWMGIVAQLHASQGLLFWLLALPAALMALLHIVQANAPHSDLRRSALALRAA